MLFDRPNIGNYQHDIVQNGLSEARVFLNREGLISSDEEPTKKHVVPKKPICVVIITYPPPSVSQKIAPIDPYEIRPGWLSSIYSLNIPSLDSH